MTKSKLVLFLLKKKKPDMRDQIENHKNFDKKAKKKKMKSRIEGPN
jgi:hypothetical protein